MTLPRWTRCAAFLAPFGIAVASAALLHAQQAPPATKKADATPGVMNKKFQEKSVDVESFVKSFESDSRDIFQAREQILKQIALKPGMAVADIGAGTGLFTRLFADAVGPTGKVYAVEVSKPFLAYIEQQAKAKGQEQIIKTVLGTQDSTTLEPRSIDVAYICATYHHFEAPEKILTSIRRALRPGGRIVLVDFDRKGAEGKFARGHARADKEVYFKEIEAAGFEIVPTPDAPRMKDNFYAEFRKLRRPNNQPVQAAQPKAKTAP